MEHYNFYKHQAECGVGTISYHSQTGRGLGSFLMSNVIRPMIPYAKKGINAVKHELINGGMNLMGDIIRNKTPLRETIANNVRRLGNNLTERAARKISAMSGGGAIKRPLKRKHNQSSSTKVGRKTKKRKQHNKAKPKEKLIKLKKEKKGYVDIFA